MTTAEIIIAALGLICGGIGSLGVWILNDIRNTLHEQIRRVNDIDNRVTHLEAIASKSWRSMQAAMEGRA